MTDKETAQRIWDLMTSEGRRSVEDIEQILTGSRADLTHADVLPDPALVAADIVNNSTDKEHMQMRIEAEI